MAASVSSAGIGSGLDVEAIITKLMNVEKVPLTKLQTTASAIDSKISAYGTLQSQFASLQDIANKLATASAWNSKTATSSDATVVKAAITDGARASATSFSVQVSQLAKAQSAASAAVAAGSATGTGTLKLQLGNWSSGSFVAKDGSSELSIDITAADATVSGVAARINAANAGVTATVVTDSTGERLLLRSSTTTDSPFPSLKRCASGKGGFVVGSAAGIAERSTSWARAERLGIGLIVRVNDSAESHLRATSPT